jgi:outer membrane protein assembly factor BamB
MMPRSLTFCLGSVLFVVTLAGCGESRQAILDGSAPDTASIPDASMGSDQNLNGDSGEGGGDTSGNDKSVWEVGDQEHGPGVIDVGMEAGQRDVAAKDAAPTDVVADVSGETGMSKCIADWPKGPVVVSAPSPSLNVTAPTILWRKWSLRGITDGDSGAEGGGIVMSGSNLVAATESGICLVDKTGEGTIASGWRPELRNYPSAATTDVDGTIYFSAPGGTYALNPDGTLKWRQKEGAVPYGDDTPGPSRGKALALDPAGVLYGVSGDQQVRAFRSSDGAVLWRYAIGQLHYPTFEDQSTVLGGAGNALFVRPGSEATRILDKRDGTEIGRLVLDDGTDSIAGWTTNFALGFSGTIFEGLWFFDTCGRPLLPTGIPTTVSSTRIDNYLGGTVGRNEGYAVYLFATDGEYNPIAKTDRLSLYDRQGNQVRGPTSGKGQPMAVGADDTLYTISCYMTNPAENRLYAYDSTLNELWHLDLGKTAHCPMGHGVLDDDGVLYLTISHEQGGGGQDMMAIQTKSPGLARSAWPMTRHDVHGTMWFVPLDSPAATDGGASATGGDGGTAETGVVGAWTERTSTT